MRAGAFPVGDKYSALTIGAECEIFRHLQATATNHRAGHFRNCAATRCHTPQLEPAIDFRVSAEEHARTVRTDVKVVHIATSDHAVLRNSYGRAAAVDWHGEEFVVSGSEHIAAKHDRVRRGWTDMKARYTLKDVSKCRRQARDGWRGCAWGERRTPEVDKVYGSAVRREHHAHPVSCDFVRSQVSAIDQNLGQIGQRSRHRRAVNGNAPQVMNAGRDAVGHKQHGRTVGRDLDGRGSESDQRAAAVYPAASGDAPRKRDRRRRYGARRERDAK